MYLIYQKFASTSNSKKTVPTETFRNAQNVHYCLNSFFKYIVWLLKTKLKPLIDAF